MTWQSILKTYGRTTDFQLFLSDVFDIPKEDSENIKASNGLMQAIDRGLFLNDITEKDFDKLMGFAQTKKYEKLIKFLEELHNKSRKQRRSRRTQTPNYRAKKSAYDKQYRQRPEVIERNRQYRQRPEVIERERKQRRERYLRNKEKLQWHGKLF